MGLMGFEKFSADMCDSRVEAAVMNRLANTIELNSTLYHIHDELISYDFFNISRLDQFPYHLRVQIAADYLLSQQGLTSRYMAENGSYRIRLTASDADRNAMKAYIRLLQANIYKKAGRTMYVKEATWQGNLWNIIWEGAPADPQAGNDARTVFPAYNTDLPYSREANLERKLPVKVKKERTGMQFFAGLAVLAAMFALLILADPNHGGTGSKSSNYTPPTTQSSKPSYYSSDYSSTNTSSSSSSSSKSSSSTSSSSKSSTPTKPKNWNGKTLPIPVGSKVTNEQIKAVSTKDMGSEYIGTEKMHRYKFYTAGNDCDYIVTLDKNNIVVSNTKVNKEINSGKKSGSSKSSSGSNKKKYSDYDKDDFPDAEEFYWWYADDFGDLFDAEDYWDD